MKNDKRPTHHLLPFSSLDRSPKLSDSFVSIIEVLQIKQSQNADKNKSFDDIIVFEQL